MTDSLGYFGMRGVGEAARLEKSQAAAMSTTCAGDLMPGIRCGRAGLYQWTSKTFCHECPVTGARFCQEHAERHAAHVRAHIAELQPTPKPREKVWNGRMGVKASYERQSRKSKRKVAAAARRANKRRAG